MHLIKVLNIYTAYIYVSLQLYSQHFPITKIGLTRKNLSNFRILMSLKGYQRKLRL